MEILIVTVLLMVWNLFVIHYVAKWFYDYYRRFEDVPAEYVSRKIVHILNGGVTTLLIPLFFEGYYWIVSVSAFVLAGYIYLRRRVGRMYWFQIQENPYEVFFAIAYGTTLMVGVILGDVWIGLIPMLFMSFGDSATGLVRAFTQKRQVKSWDGTIAMFTVCSIIGFWRLGWYGVLIGGVVSLIEKIPRVDDNVTVAVVSALLVYLSNLVN